MDAEILFLPVMPATVSGTEQSRLELSSLDDAGLVDTEYVDFIGLYTLVCKLVQTNTFQCVLHDTLGGSIDVKSRRREVEQAHGIAVFYNV